MRILIVEDEVRLASMIKDTLVHAKYFVDVVHDGEIGLDYARSGIYDGLIFDAMLPSIDGLTAADTLKKELVTTPILLLTSRSNSAPPQDKQLYLTKPFQKDQLLNAVTTLLEEIITKEEELFFGDLTLHLHHNTLACQGETIPLSARELELARLLFTFNDIVPKETIFLKIWGYDSEAESNVVEAYVSFLRRKMRHLKSTVSLVAIRRKGYRLNLEKPEETEPAKPS